MSGKLIGGYKTHTAKKEYTCSICGKPIPVGERYMECFIVDDEKHAWGEKEHVCCHNMMSEYCGKCPDFDGECWDSDCFEHACHDSVCPNCNQKVCPPLPSRCDKMWELLREKYGKEEAKR